MSYKKLRVWQIARALVVDIHRMTLTELPKFETYEQGSQIRRAIKSVKANIVEGYGRRRYRQDYVRFLVYAHASCDEAKDHLETLAETGSMKNRQLFDDLHIRLEELSKALNGLIDSVAAVSSTVRNGKESIEWDC
jgi:four helix bundle protein